MAILASPVTLRSRVHLVLEVHKPVLATAGAECTDCVLVVGSLCESHQGFHAPALVVRFPVVHLGLDGGMGTGFWVGPDFLVVEDEVAKISGVVVGNVLVVHLMGY